MSKQAAKINVTELIYVENKAIMINMENHISVVKQLLDIIKNLEDRVTELDGK